MKERKTFTFDGENSADYGLYISGDSVYNAPNREIDMVSIPGRNGQLAIDMGRYENITVTYPAFVFADTQEEFREKIRRIRNWLCSKTSYQRLTDEYNPESFRLGLYKSGLEVEPIFYNRCGEFKMSFDCKPQRFLFTGEEVFTLGEWGETETYSGSIVSFEGTETTAVKSLTAQIVPKQAGSGDPSPSNVRPISGWSSVNVKRIGKNFLKVNGYDLFRQYGYYDRNELTDSSVILDPPTVGWPNIWVAYKNVPIGTPITFSGTYTNPNGNGARPTIALGSVDPSDTTFLNYADIVKETITEVGTRTFSLTATIPSGRICALRITASNTNDISMVTQPFKVENMQLELGSTATDYKPYQGNTYPISLGQTVYGGTLEVCSGKLAVTKGFRLFDGSESWGFITSTDRNRVNITVAERTDAYVTDILGNYIKPVSEPASLPPIWSANINNLGGLLVGVPTSITSANDWKTYLSSNPLQIVYPLATPTEITLTPTQVNTLLGNNNIWADSGDVTVEIGENPYILVNPTKFEATPIFEVEGSGTLSVGDTSLTINNAGTTIIDTEMMEAYEDDNGAIISRNDDVEGGFPTLTSGINNVEADGLTSVKITPKFWEL